MQNSSVTHDNAASLPARKKRVLIVGPAGLAIEETNALKFAFEEGGARVSVTQAGSKGSADAPPARPGVISTVNSTGGMRWTVQDNPKHRNTLPGCRQMPSSSQIP